MFCPNPNNFLSLKVQFHEYTIWLPINIMGDKYYYAETFLFLESLGLYHIDWELQALKVLELKFWIELLTFWMTWPNTVEPVLSGHPWGMAKWPLNTGWLPNIGCKKYTSKNYVISSADQIRCLTSNRNIHFQRFNDLRK